jgi:purine-nucleoside phosphorylase
MREAARLIEARTSIRPAIGVVLGSGLGGFADSLVHSMRIPYQQLPGMPEATAVGHEGEFVVGTLGANGAGTTDVAVMSGRFHLYEGYTPKQVTSGVRLFGELGVRVLVITNAAGGINPEYERGALVSISDHINLQGANPLVGRDHPGPGSRFTDMTEAYSPWMRAMALETAAELGIRLHEGVYAAVLGPSYETPAEIRYLKTIGADLVGMSTVPEVIAANHLGMEVLGISCVTNVAAGLSGEKLVHADVLEIGRRASGTLLKLLTSLLGRVQAR